MKMKTYFKLLSLGILLTFIACDKNKDIVLEEEETTDTTSTSIDLKITGTGHYTFDAYEPLSDKPVEVYYHIPDGATSTSPVLMVFHGNGRDALECRDILIEKSNQYNFLVVVPEFSKTYYPGGDQYNMGNIFEDGDHPSANTLNDESVWTFSIVDPLYEHFKTKTGTGVEYYDVFGHSAGGQFVHRFVMFKPNAHFQNIVAASSGWYTVPDETVEFPYGIGSSPITTAELAPFFSLPLTVMIGEADNDPNAASLRHNSIVDQQGDDRLERAQYFYTNSQSIALQNGYSFSWVYRSLPNVDHDFSATSIAAANILYR